MLDSKCIGQFKEAEILSTSFSKVDKNAIAALPDLW